MSELTDERLAEIRANRQAFLNAYAKRLDDPRQMSVGDLLEVAGIAADDVAPLLAEVERLKGELDEEQRTGGNAVGMLAIAAKDIDEWKAEVARVKAESDARRTADAHYLAEVIAEREKARAEAAEVGAALDREHGFVKRHEATIAELRQVADNWNSYSDDVVDQLRARVAELEEKLAARTKPHVPTLAPHREGFGVHCIACSDAAQDYIWPCTVVPNRDNIPARVAAVDALDGHTGETSEVS